MRALGSTSWAKRFKSKPIGMRCRAPQAYQPSPPDRRQRAPYECPSVPTPALRGCQRSRVTLPPQRPPMRTPRSAGSGVGQHGIGGTKPATGPFPDRGRGPAIPAAGGAGLCWLGISPVDRPLRPHPTRPPLGPRQGAAAPYPPCASVMLARLRRPGGAARPRLRWRALRPVCASCWRGWRTACAPSTPGRPGRTTCGRCPGSSATQLWLILA